MGVTQFNIKKVLAYSTMSQIGLMVMACGVGAFSVGLFHLYTHAFFKACLFLAAGAVLHALAGEEDMRHMGGLARRMPFTFGVFLLATLALCGLPPFAGFFSKDEILWSAYASSRGSVALWLVGTAASFLTAFYMFRAVFMTFFGASRVDTQRRAAHPRAAADHVGRARGAGARIGRGRLHRPARVLARGARRHGAVLRPARPRARPRRTARRHRSLDRSRC